MAEETQFPSEAIARAEQDAEQQVHQQARSSSTTNTNTSSTHQPLTNTGHSKPQTRQNIEMFIEKAKEGPLKNTGSTKPQTKQNIEMLIEKAKEGPKLIFPMQLHKLLRLSEEYGANEIVSWFPNGKAFRVHNRRSFEAMIMKRFFNQSVYRSFLRQLNGWGFTRVINGDEVMEGAYQHPLFSRDQPELCRRMIRAKVSKPSSSSGKKKKTSAAPGAAAATSASSKDSVVSHGSAASTSSEQSNPLLLYQQQLLGNKRRRMMDSAATLNTLPGTVPREDNMAMSATVPRSRDHTLPSTQTGGLNISRGGLDVSGSQGPFLRGSVLESHQLLEHLQQQQPLQQQQQPQQQLEVNTLSSFRTENTSLVSNSAHRSLFDPRSLQSMITDPTQSFTGWLNDPDYADLLHSFLLPR